MTPFIIEKLDKLGFKVEARSGGNVDALVLIARPKVVLHDNIREGDGVVVAFSGLELQQLSGDEFYAMIDRRIESAVKCWGDMVWSFGK